MFVESSGNLLASTADAYVNPVNTVGVMGAGLALAFKKRWPEMFEDYRLACDGGLLRAGQMHVWANPGAGPSYVINFPTKRHYRDSARLSDVESGLVALRDVLNAAQITSVAIPPLGCGLGGLDWAVVEPMVRSHLDAYARANTVALFSPR